MKEPVTIYSPLSGVLETWLPQTQNAGNSLLSVQALEWHTAHIPASFRVTGEISWVDGLRITVEAAPGESAWT